VSHLEFVHACNFVHHDILPSNLLIGTGMKHNPVYLIDFGLACAYQSHKTHCHIPHKEQVPFVGTPRFASIDSHLSIKYSCRDDLESLAYVLIYLLRNSLPWDACEPLTTAEIIHSKLDIGHSSLCENLPCEFFMFLDYARTLPFADRPDYMYIQRLFNGLLCHSGIVDDLDFS
ncbi:kinase-like protein, partial [Gyrodon lividus]